MTDHNLLTDPMPTAEIESLSLSTCKLSKLLDWGNVRRIVVITTRSFLIYAPLLFCTTKAKVAVPTTSASYLPIVRTLLKPPVCGSPCGHQRCRHFGRHGSRPPSRPRFLARTQVTSHRRSRLRSRLNSPLRCRLIIRQCFLPILRRKSHRASLHFPRLLLDPLQRVLRLNHQRCLLQRQATSHHQSHL
jgi:hypothetical protein